MKWSKDSPAYVIAFAAVVSAAFTAAIMAIHAAADGAVRRNERLLRQKALVEVFGLGDPAALGPGEIAERVERRVAEVTPPLIDAQTGRRLAVYKAYAPDRREVAAYAFPIGGVGFWAQIDGLLAVDRDATRIVGIVFLSHSETPGLGGRITTDRAWREQFRGLKLPSPAAAGEKLIHVGGDGPSGPSDARFGRHVDALTGATGTSTAVEQFVNRDLESFLRALREAQTTRPGDLE